MLIIIAILTSFVLGCEQRAVDHEQVSPEDRIVIKFSHVVSETSPKGMAAKRFAQLVNKRTDNRVEVQVYANSTLYKDGEEIEALQSGRIQMIAPATAKIGGYFPELAVFDLPFMFENYDQVHNFVDGVMGTELITNAVHQEMLGLCFWDNGFKQIAAHEGIVNVTDYSGLKFRIMDSELLNAQFATVGATTEVMPFNEVYTALENQQVDGIENTLSNIYTKKFHNELSQIIISNHGYLGYVVITNKSFWDNLPEDIKIILTETLEEVTLWQREVAKRQNQKSLDELSLLPVEVTYLSDEQRKQWATAFAPVYDKLQQKIKTSIIKNVITERQESLISAD